MLPVAWLGDPESDQMQKIIKEFTKVVRLGVNPLVLLARVDEIEPTIRQDPSSPGEEVKKAVKQAAKLLGIPDANVIPNVNYLEEHQKSFEIDRNLWIIVHRALSQSKHYLEYLELQAKQETAKRDKGAPLIRQKLNEAEKLRDLYHKRAETSEGEVRKGKDKAKKLEKQVAELKEHMEKEVAAKERALRSAAFWRSVFTTTLIAGLVAIIVFSPKYRAGLVAGLLSTVKSLRCLATMVEEKLQGPSLGAAGSPSAAAPVATAAVPLTSTAALPTQTVPVPAATAAAPSVETAGLSDSTLLSPDSSYVIERAVAGDGTVWHRVADQGIHSEYR